MKVAIIGANGQLGSELAKAFPDAILLMHADLDVENWQAIENFFANNKVDAVINTAAYHDTPKCEQEPLKAFSVNAIGAKNLAEQCAKTNTIFVHLSTDYVFDGMKGRPYKEIDAPNPLNWYAMSKFTGELAIANTPANYYIIRVCGLFGQSGCRAKGGGNFVETMLKKLAAGEEFKVTNDQTVSPTYAFDAAQAIKEILEKKLPFGIYHVVNAGHCTWYDFAKEIAKQIKSKTSMLPCASGVDGLKRPNYSALSITKLKKNGIAMRPWKAALAHYLKNKTTQN